MRKVKQCLLCQAKKFRLFYSSRDRMFNLPGEFRVKKCSSCGLVFLDPRPSSELKKYYPSSQYYAYSSDEEKNFFQKLREYLVKHYYQPNLISRLIACLIHNVPAMPVKKPKGKLLDLGCGVGDTLSLLKGLGWDVYGIEIDQKAVEIAKKRGLTKVRLGSYQDLEKYPDEYFDVIRLYHVIEHLDNPLACLKQLGPKLKKEGELIVGTPNIDSLAAKLFGPYWYNLDSPRHLFLFTPQTLSRMLLKANFRIKTVDFCSIGGLVGSCQYIIQEKLGLKLDLLRATWLVLLIFPIEWLLDKLHLGDVFVIRAVRQSAKIRW